MLKPAVHIILPIYNGQDYILQQLMSIYYQNYTNWALYIINDGTTDGSIQIIQKFIKDYGLSSKVSIFHNEKNIGLNGSIEVGLRQVKNSCVITDFVSFCDADDIWTTNKLSVQIQFMIKHPSCDLSYHDLVPINEYNNIIADSYLKILQKVNNNIYDNTFSEFCTSQHITATSIIFRSQFIDDILPLPLYFCQDYWTLLIFSFLKRNIVEVPFKLAYYRQHEKSMQAQQKMDSSLLFGTLAKVLGALDTKYDDPLIKYYKKYNEDRSLWTAQKKSFLIQMLLILIHYPKMFKLFIRKIFVYLFFRRLK